MNALSDIFQARLSFALGVDSMVAERPLMTNNSDCPTNECRVSQYTSLAACAECEEQEILFGDLWNSNSSKCYRSLTTNENFTTIDLEPATPENLLQLIGVGRYKGRLWLASSDRLLYRKRWLLASET
jgi:hypothetical protein